MLERRGYVLITASLAAILHAPPLSHYSATKAGVEGGRFHIHAPLLAMTKAEIVKKGLELGLDYSLTHSCYDPLPDGRPCGRCDSCILRAKGFAEAGLQDPVVA